MEHESRGEDELVRALTRAYAGAGMILVAVGVCVTLLLAKTVPPIREMWWPTSIELPLICRTVFQSSVIAEVIWPWTLATFVPACWLVYVLSRKRATSRAARLRIVMHEGAALREARRIEMLLQIAVLILTGGVFILMVIGVYQPDQFWIKVPR